MHLFFGVKVCFTQKSLCFIEEISRREHENKSKERTEIETLKKHANSVCVSDLNVDFKV